MVRELGFDHKPYTPQAQQTSFGRQSDKSSHDYIGETLFVLLLVSYVKTKLVRLFVMYCCSCVIYHDYIYETVLGLLLILCHMLQLNS